MKTIDIHSHLLSPDVSFNRPLDRFVLHFFAKRLGADPRQLREDPFNSYVESMARAIQNSSQVEKCCLFGVDSRIDNKGEETHKDITVCASTEDVLQVTARYPDQFIPFMSVNPKRADALDLIDEYHERGCLGSKFLQNYWGADLNNPAFIPYYEKLKALKLPVIIHIGPEYTIHSYTEYERFDMVKLPLECGVTVIAAHMGLGRPQWPAVWRSISRNPTTFDTDYHQLLEKLEQHDNLYADISAILTPLKARALRHLSRQTQIHHKILFGTDYPVPYTLLFNTYDLSLKERLRINKIDNPFDAYHAAITEYFPKESPIYTNYKKVIHLLDTEPGNVSVNR